MEIAAGCVFVYHPHEETPQLAVAAFAIGSDNRAT
jgi:hypothetical protein